MTRQKISALLGMVGLALVASCAALEGNDGDDENEGSTGGDAGTTSIQVGGTGGDAGSSGSGGRSGSGGTGGGSTAPECTDLKGLGDCGAQSTQAQAIEVNMLLVIDKSGSMDNQPAGYETSLWDGLKTALNAALNNVDVSSSMSLGLLLYPDQAVEKECGGFETCCLMNTSSGVDVPVGFGNDTVPQILAKLEETSPGGGTPIAKALSKAYDYFHTGEGSALGGDRFVLLATDGGPNCNDSITCTADACTRNLEGSCSSAPDNCCATQPAGCVDDAAVLDAIARLKSINVETFVVGIPGSEAYASYLDTFALEGGRPVTGATHSYYEVAASGGVEALTDTFQSITINLVRSCEIELADRPADIDSVNVAVDCNVITKNEGDADNSSWSFSEDYKTITIGGAACERIKETGARRIDTVFGCGTIY